MRLGELSARARVPRSTIKFYIREGMLPSGAGNYAAGADKGAVRVTAINKPDKSAPTGVTEVQKLTAGPTATGFALTKACYR